MKISELIEKLKEYEKQYGDVPVLINTPCYGEMYGEMDWGHHNEVEWVFYSEEDNVVHLEP